jgi:hypothetical protein
MRTALALVLAVAVAPAARADEPVTLKWNLKEGETLFAKGVTNMDMTMGILGMDVEMKMKMTGVQRYKILSVKQGETKIEMTILALEMKTDAAGMELPGLGDVNDKLKGATVTAVLNDEFEVKKIEGRAKFIEKIAGDDKMMQKLIEAQFSDAALGQMVTQVFAFAPKKPIKVGETWNRTDKMPAAGIGEAEVKQKFKLDSVKGDVANLTIDAEMKFKQGDGGLPGLPEGVKISKFDLKADKFTGTAKFDTKLGRLTENKQKMDLSGSISMSVGGQDIDVKMKIKSVTDSTVSDKNPITD